MDDPEYQHAVVNALRGDLAPEPNVLDALSMVEQIGQLPIFESLVAIFGQHAAGVRKYAARLVARCFSARCPELTHWFHDPEVRFECCFSQDRETATALMQWYVAAEHSPDVAFGLLLTPEAVSHLMGLFPKQGLLIAQRFGYVETPSQTDAAQILEQGAWWVPAGFFEKDFTTLAQRTIQVESALLAILAGSDLSDDPNFDFQSAMDLAALCGAVRSLDHGILVKRKFENRLQARAQNNIRQALCKHAPFPYCFKILVTDPRQAAESLGVPSNLWGRYLLEHAAVAVTPDSDLRNERLLYLKSRWTRRPEHRSFVPSRWTFPVEQDSDAPELKYRVLTPKQLMATRPYLDAPSPGALSVARLLQVCGLSELIQPVFDFEESVQDQLVPCGIEIQIPFSPKRECESLAWKQALRALGIPSPRRPEYRAMVEVAFPPSRSYLPQVLAPLLLVRLGLIAEPVDMALHLSFSGDLGDEVRFLLFTQMLINLPMVKPRPTRLARLMSKGFVHLHDDAVPLDGVRHFGMRTELRSCRFGYRGASETEPLQEHYIDDLIETALLIAANESHSVELQLIWTDFCIRVTEAVGQLPDVFATLLWEDWYAATEDSQDETFALRLPISQAWIAVSDWLKTHGKASEVRQTFGQIRTIAATEARIGLDVKSVLHGKGRIRSAKCGADYICVLY